MGIMRGSWLADEILLQPTSPPRRPRRRSRALLPASCSGSCSASSLVGGAAAAGADRLGPELRGARPARRHRGGIDLTGMDRAQASAALNKAYDPVTTGRVVVETDAGDVSVPYTQFGRHVDTDAMVQEALETGRAGTTAERALGEIRLALTGQTSSRRSVLDRPRSPPASRRRCPGWIGRPSTRRSSRAPRARTRSRPRRAAGTTGRPPPRPR